MHKLHLCLDVYRGLGMITATRADTLAKVASMLLHPFPKVPLRSSYCIYALLIIIGPYKSSRNIMVLNTRG